MISFVFKVAGWICAGEMAQVAIAMFATYCFFEATLRIASPQLTPVLHRLAIGPV